MNKVTMKIAGGIATAALLAATCAPAAFASTIHVNGNGNKSHNHVKVKNNRKHTVNQKSKTTVHTTVHSTSKTGGNKANGNTGGGDVKVTTGDASNTTSVLVTSGDNVATLSDPCNCSEDDVITVSGNGNKSHNSVTVNNSSSDKVDQSTSTDVCTTVDTVSNTGGNKANNNTGDGDVTVGTGDAANRTTVTVIGGSNELNQ